MTGEWYVKAPAPPRQTTTQLPAVSPPLPRECVFDEDREERERVGRLEGSTALSIAQEQILREMHDRRERMREQQAADAGYGYDDDEDGA